MDKMKKLKYKNNKFNNNNHKKLLSLTMKNLTIKISIKIVRI